MKKKFITTSLFILFLFISCSNKEKKDFVVIGIPNDIETINPLYSFSVEEGNITELMFLSLLESNWDSVKGEIEYRPMLAKSWEWGSGNESLIIELRDDVYWTDGTKCTIEDVIFSFDIYSDPKVKSRAFGYFDKFYTDENGRINLTKTFEKLGNNKLKINFKKNSNPDLLEIDHPILPKHFFEKYKREEIPTINVTESLITNGPYKLERWEREQLVVLTKNEGSFLLSKSSIPKIVFKIIPEYQMRLNQLTHSEIDLMEDIKTDDMEGLKGNEKLKVVPISGRDFDYIGWNNISPEHYKNSEIIPHRLFGSAKVRRALTHALNRSVVTEDYLSSYGQLASTPLSPIFTSLYNSTITPLSYNPNLAVEILLEDGWSDSNYNGTIDKNGIEFEFTLHIPSGNPRREFAASLFQNNLKAIGIDMRIELNELGIFIDNLFSKQFDAWMAAWVVPIPVNLNISWYSDLSQTPLNFPSYQNKELDKLFNRLSSADKIKEAEIYSEIQKILYNDKPYTFLYWIDNIACYNNRIKNIEIDPLGAIKHSWKWTINSTL
ncbi:MAG: ABC transporter substrate-binding protein [Melioribacteraceae bacterium]|nr:ABC transporter substrate-binding protein [Melioribacteraceae bacterium]